MTSRWMPLAAAATLLLAGLSVAPGAEAAPARVLSITAAVAQPTVPWKAFDGQSVKLFDFNGDGVREIVAQNDNQWVYVLDSKTGKILAEVTTVFPSGWTARTFSGPEAAILASGESPRLVVANSAAVVTAFRLDLGATTRTHVALVKEWERRLDGCHTSPGMDSKPVLVDLDRDGRLDILAATEEMGIYALRADGSILWKNCMGGGNAEPTVADLDLDGWPEVVFGSDGGVVSAIEGRNGAIRWQVELTKLFPLGSGSIPVGVGVGQLDGVGGPDVVAGARDSHDAEQWGNNHALLVAISSEGKVLWGRQHPQANPLTYTRPVVVDADRDGVREVYWADWNTMGHKPPYDPALAWKVTGPANFYRYDAAGNLVWRQSLPTWWNNKDVPLGDVDGDGRQEMLANAPESNGHDGLYVLDTATGAKEGFIDAWPWKVTRAPTLGDLWGTGTLQIVLPADQADPSAGGPAILVYDTKAPYDAAWPGPPGPVAGTPVPPPPPPPRFAATFTVKSPSAWWQELYVDAGGRSLATVHLRINDEVWRPMAKSTWGAWTSSINTPAGAKVEFLARDVTGAESQSQPFTWMDGTLTRPSTDGPASPAPPPPPPPPPTTTPTTSPPPPAPPPGFFAATFTVTSPNAWWQQVTVRPETPRTLSSVQLRVEGGAWQEMRRESWGDWTRSIHTPAGSRVEFLAVDTAGARSQSLAFTWMDGTRTQGSTTTTEPPPSSFSATFKVSPNVNSWWVEVSVQATGGTLSSVDVQVNGGAWVALGKTSWGTWAKSFHVPSGSDVRFRGTSAAGETVVSPTTPWR